MLARFNSTRSVLHEQRVFTRSLTPSRSCKSLYTRQNQPHTRVPSLTLHAGMCATMHAFFPLSHSPDVQRGCCWPSPSLVPQRARAWTRVPAQKPRDGVLEHGPCGASSTAQERGQQYAAVPGRELTTLRVRALVSLSGRHPHHEPLPQKKHLCLYGQFSRISLARPFFTRPLPFLRVLVRLSRSPCIAASFLLSPSFCFSVLDVSVFYDVSVSNLCLYLSLYMNV